MSTAAVAATITGSVALTAVVTNWVTTAINLRHQRLADARRQRHEHDLRILDTALSTAVTFLGAADGTTRARQGNDTANRSWDNARTSADEKVVDHYRGEVTAAQERVFEAISDAEKAYTALRLLIPAAASDAREYLDLCRSADVHPDENKPDRDEARQRTERAIQRELHLLRQTADGREPVKSKRQSRKLHGESVPAADL